MSDLTETRVPIHEVEVNTVSEEAPEPGMTDCRNAGYCEREEWECRGCSSYAPRDAEPVRPLEEDPGYWPEAEEVEPVIEEVDPFVGIPIGKREFLASLGVVELRERSRDLLVALATDRAIAIDLRSDLRRAQELIEIHEAQLTLSEPFKELKNDASRKAWLLEQRSLDGALAALIERANDLRRRLEAQEARVDGLGESLKVVLAEMRLVSYQLAFLGEN